MAPRCRRPSVLPVSNWKEFESSLAGSGWRRTWAAHTPLEPVHFCPFLIWKASDPAWWGPGGVALPGPKSMEAFTVRGNDSTLPIAYHIVGSDQNCVKNIGDEGAVRTRT